VKAEQLTTWVGIVAGVLTGVSLLPQLIKLIRKKKSDDLSFAFLGVLLLGLALWIWYGFLKDDLPIIITNSFSLIVNMLMIVLGLRYKK
jgi:MtN3 and saliva related transmembrane protein